MFIFITLRRQVINLGKKKLVFYINFKDINIYFLVILIFKDEDKDDGDKEEKEKDKKEFVKKIEKKVCLQFLVRSL